MTCTNVVSGNRLYRQFGRIVRGLALGIKSENYVLLADLGAQVVLVLRRSKKDDNESLLRLLKKEEDYELKALVRRVLRPP